MKIHTIETAQHGEWYQVYIPGHVAKEIKISLDDGYGSYYEGTLGSGFYTAYCRHDIHAIGEPKYWEIQERADNFNGPESDSLEIKAVLLTDLKKLMEIES